MRDRHYKIFNALAPRHRSQDKTAENCRREISRFLECKRVVNIFSFIFHKCYRICFKLSNWWYSVWLHEVSDMPQPELNVPKYPHGAQAQTIRFRFVDIWNVNCARATAFIFDTRTGVHGEVSNFLRQKMSRPEGTRTLNHIHIYIYLIVDDQSNIYGITLFHNVSRSWLFIPSKSINWLYTFMYVPLNCLIRIKHCYMLLRDNLAKPLIASGAVTSYWWPDCKVKDSENTWGLYY